jgi:uncharacterized small protein (DUF1192 family)
MRIPRSIAIRAGLSATAVLALGLAVSGVWLLPRKADALRAEADRIGADLGHKEPGRAAAPGTVPIPTAAALPAGAAAVVDAVRRQGVGDVQYRLGQRVPRGTLSAQPLTLFFEAGFPAVARVLADVAASAPAVTVTGVDLERADRGRIEVALRLDLLGGA